MKNRDAQQPGRRKFEDQSAKAFAQELSKLAASQPIPDSDSEDWDGLLGRISTVGVVNEVSEGTYDYFLSVLPPRWTGHNSFAYAEGMEPFRLFWTIDGKFYCLQLTWEQTHAFMRWPGLPLR